MLPDLSKREISENDDNYAHYANRKGDWHWSYNVMLFGLFFGILSLVYVGSNMFVTKIFLSKTAAFFLFIGLVIPMKYYSKWLLISKIEAFMLSLFGIGPIVMGALLWMNFLIAAEKTEKTFAIVRAELITDFDGRLLFYFEGDALADYPEFRMFEITPEMAAINKVKTVTYKINKGILGYQVLKSRKINR